MKFIALTSRQSRLRRGCGHTYQTAHLPFAGWSIITVSMVTTSLDSILFLGMWREHTQKMLETTLWGVVKDLVSHLMLLTKYTSIISPAFKKLHFILNLFFT